MRKIAYVIGAFFIGLPSQALALDKDQFQWSGFAGCDTPESAYYHSATQTLFISNIAGDLKEKDKNGFISALTPEGEVKFIRWVEGMNAPKGMRSYENRLYVSDIDEVIEIDIEKRTIVRRFKVPGAIFLNDIAIGPKGILYVSDTVGNKIFSITRTGKVTTLVEGEQTESPNGLFVDGALLMIATWGTEMDANWGTTLPGRLLALDLDSKKIHETTPRERIGNLDGLEKTTGGEWIVSDWMAGKVMHLTEAGEVKEILSGFKGAADIGYIPEKQLLIVPRMNENKVTAYSLKK